MRDLVRSGLKWAAILTLPATLLFENVSQSAAVAVVCPAQYSEFRFVSTQRNGDHREVNGSTLCSVPGAYEACAFGRDEGCTEEPVNSFLAYGAILGAGFLLSLLPGFGIAWMRRRKPDQVDAASG